MHDGRDGAEISFSWVGRGGSHLPRRSKLLINTAQK